MWKIDGNGKKEKETKNTVKPWNYNMNLTNYMELQYELFLFIASDDDSVQAVFWV